MTRVYVYAGLGACITALLLGLYWRGYHEGRKNAELERLQATVEATRNRKEIDNELKNNDSHALCLELDGLPELCQPLRRMEPKPES